MSTSLLEIAAATASPSLTVRRGQAVEQAMSAARTLGYRAMPFNQVMATNAAAIHLCESLGCGIVGRRRSEVAANATSMLWSVTGSSKNSPGADHE